MELPITKRSLRFGLLDILIDSDIVTRVAPVEEGYEFYRCGIDKVFFDCDASGYTEHISRTKTSTTGTVKETRWYTTKVNDAIAKVDSTSTCSFNG